MSFLIPLRNIRQTARPIESYEDSAEPLLGSPGKARTTSTYRRLLFFLRRGWRSITLRHILLLLAITPVILVLILLRNGIPPKFENIRAYERSLPQHNMSEALYDPNFSRPGRRKYLRVEGQVWGRGFNNVLQEVAGRVFVFEDYTWSHLPLPYTIYDFALRPTRTPLNAYISGASAGGLVSSDHFASLRSVSVEFFDVVCPKEQRTTLSSADAPRDSDGVEIVDWWLAKLGEVEIEPCVIIDSTEKDTEVFDWKYFGSTRALSGYHLLKDSPSLLQFSWSPLVQSAVTRNFAVLKPQNYRSLLDISRTSVIDGLVAIHLRRGDFKGHCLYLHKYSAEYIGLNQLDGLPDRFKPPQDPRESKAYYMKHCLPNIDQIVERLHQIRQENPSKHLKRVFLMSNGWGWWLSKLSSRLREDGWTDVINSYDFELDAAQTQVSGAIDMAIAEKAEVFIGNGFSSMSANIIMFRSAKGLPASSNRFL
ncbi:hypothetical protein VNI00_013075 [Paramarasmius palmivorus]|uniref:Uncharacterized protein n=1 Tax=Paramarasmius palmivorus TaxID=297713 RepID=A0AAW0C1G7_9AGAR